MFPKFLLFQGKFCTFKVTKPLPIKSKASFNFLLYGSQKPWSGFRDPPQVANQNPVHFTPSLLSAIGSLSLEDEAWKTVTSMICISMIQVGTFHSGCKLNLLQLHIYRRGRAKSARYALYPPAPPFLTHPLTHPSLD